MQADPHKLDFRSDPLARLPGTGGLGPLGPIGGGLPPTHDLTRPPSLFSATGVHFNMVVSQDHGNKRKCLFFLGPPLNTCHGLLFTTSCPLQPAEFMLY